MTASPPPIDLLADLSDVLYPSAQTNPATVSAVKFGFQASDLTGYTNGQNVTTGTAPIGGFTLTGLTSGGYPTYLASAVNGLPAVRFNANPGCKLQSNWPISAFSPNASYTIFAIIRVQSHGTLDYLGWNDAGNGNRLTAGAIATGLLLFPAGDDAGTQIQSDYQAPIPSAFFLMVCESRSGTINIRLNGVAQTSTASAPTTNIGSTNDFNIGGCRFGANADIAAAYVADATLTTNQRNGIEAYLAQRYGFGLTQTIQPTASQVLIQQLVASGYSIGGTPILTGLYPGPASGFVNPATISVYGPLAADALSQREHMLVNDANGGNVLAIRNRSFPGYSAVRFLTAVSGNEGGAFGWANANNNAYAGTSGGMYLECSGFDDLANGGRFRFVQTGMIGGLAYGTYLRFETKTNGDFVIYDLNATPTSVLPMFTFHPTGDMTAVGAVTAASFIGDGSALTGTTAALSTHIGLTGAAVHGLGTASTHATTDFDSSGAAATVNTALTTHTGLTGTAVHGLGTASTRATGDFDAAGAAAALTLQSVTGVGATSTNAVTLTAATDVNTPLTLAAHSGTQSASLAVIGAKSQFDKDGRLIGDRIRGGVPGGLVLDWGTLGQVQVFDNNGVASFVSVTQSFVATAFFGFPASSSTLAIGSDGPAISFRASSIGGTEVLGLNLSTGALTCPGPVNSTVAQTTVNASTSGSAVFSQPLAGSSLKKVVIYLNAALGTASYTFPTVFTNTPGAIGPKAATATSISTTAVTVTGATDTGYLFLEGY